MQWKAPFFGIATMKPLFSIAAVVVTTMDLIFIVIITTAIIFLS